MPENLYYICHVSNIESILENGIFARAQIKKKEIKHEDIHDDGVLMLRDKEVPSGKNLREYVNLYFQARNAMLYRLVQNFGRENLAILSIKSSVIESEGSYFTDRNAATHAAEFYSDIKKLNRIDKKILKNEYWTDSADTKQKMMAEVLVEDKVSPDNIMAIYLPQKSDTIKKLVGSKNISIIIEHSMFFHPTFLKKISDNISLSQGDMFFSGLQTFTISVNLKGVMGKGLAARTKYQFPDAYVRYQDDCKNSKLQVGKPTLYKRGTRIEDELADDSSQLKEASLNGTRWFLFLPTKRDWHQDSRFEDIEKSMEWLVKNYKKQGIKSIALPALGCGLGNLQWRQVGPMMCHHLNKMNIKSCIYLPAEGKIDPSELQPEFLLNDYKPKLEI